jgi:hypothetical protein
MTDRLTETGRCCGMGMNVEITKVLKISKKPFPLQTVVVQKQLKNFGIF